MVAELPASERNRPDDARVLRTLAVYRLLLVLLLAGICLSGIGSYLFDQSNIDRVLLLTIIYLLPALMLLAASLDQRISLQIQAHLAFFVDTVSILSLMYASRGVSSGLGVLLVTPAVGCSLVLSQRLGLLHAALGTFALFGTEAWRQSMSSYNASELTTAGLLGLMLFATALGAGAVAQRARRSEALAARFGSDLASASRLNERIVESMDTPVIVLDEDRQVRLTNAAAKRLLLPGAPDTGLKTLPAPLQSALDRWEANPNREREPLSLQAGEVEVLPRFSRLGYSSWAPVLVLLDDATQLREQAQQLKLAALGRLSAGIAHEIRNPLSAIHHASQLLAESPQLGAEDRRLLDMIQRHSVRIDKIVGDVLKLSRRSVAAPQSLLLREFLDRALAVYRETCPDQLRPISILPGSEGLQVRFDPNHLQQILHNLWQNSFDHGARGGKAVSIRLQGGRLNPGQRPYLDVSDDGDGVPAEQQERLFEPFVTTAHHGTGLGLYLSRELCEYNQGRLLYLPSERGTRFRIIFATG